MSLKTEAHFYYSRYWVILPLSCKRDISHILVSYSAERNGSRSPSLKRCIVHTWKKKRKNKRKNKLKKMKSLKGKQRKQIKRLQKTQKRLTSVWKRPEMEKEILSSIMGKRSHKRIDINMIKPS